MNVLLAPNGKPSNLTPEQYKLVRTPAFKEWFGDWEKDPKNSSKVIDENGEPLVCYHGSNNPNVNIFDTEKSGSVQYSDWGKGIYFTPSKSTADYYSNEALKKIDSEYNRLYEVFEKTQGYTDLKAFQNRGRELTLNVDTIVYSVFLNIKNPLIEPTSGMNDPFLSEIAISNNKDGVFIMNNMNFWSYDEILAFESNQVKLADGTNTTFDGNNPDIRFEEGGLVAPNGKPSNLTPEQYKLVRTPAFKEWFGDWEKDPKNSSKVIDENGEPLVVWHGSNNDFNVFEKSKTNPYADKQGYFFAYNKKYAESYNSKYLKSYFINLRVKGTFDDDDNLVPINADGVIVKDLQVEVYDKKNVKLADGTNTTFDSNNPDIRFKEGGNVNWNIDRYRQIEKEMYELSNQGKQDSLEYFKLIKERSILEKNKTENMDNQTTEKFAKGGKILIKQITDNGNTINVHKDFEKFKRIGIEDKYFIEASNDIGLQGVVFNKDSLLKKITVSFNNLLENYNDYIISKDSEGITFVIENNIKEMQIGGRSLEAIQNERDKLTNEFERLKIMQDFANTQREALVKWIDYLSQSDYPHAFLYLMLKAVLTFNYDLKLNRLFERTNETTRNITPFDAGTLSDLFHSNSNYLLQDYAQLMSENSQKILNSKEVIDETEKGKWIKFNGGSKTPPTEIEKNGKQLMQLVQNTYWCTKNAGGDQLKGGDFYVYVTESGGEVLPQIAVRMNENEVGEIRGNESSSQDLSAESLPVARNFLTKNIPNNSGKKWLDSIEYNERCVEMGNRFEQEGLYENFISDYLELLSQKSKYKVDYGDNGNVVAMVRKFEEAKEKLPNQYYERGDIESNYLMLSPLTKYFIGNLGRYEMQTLSSQNINLSDLSNWKLKYISGSFDCADIVTNLGSIEFVGGDLTLSQITNDFGSVKHIGGIFEMGSAQIMSLGNIESIGSGFVVNSNLTDLGKLKKVGWLSVLSCGEQFTFGDLEEVKGDLIIKVSDKNFDVGNLKTVGGSFDASKTLLTDLKGLESVGRDFSIAGSKIKLFENLKTIGGNADFSNNFSSSTQNIELILGSIKLLNSRIMDFPKLIGVGGSIELRGSYLKSFGNIKVIGTDLDLVEGKIEDLGNLEEINGFVNFKGSQVKSLNKLKKIVSFANFSDSLVEDLGDLETIGGNAYFNDTNIKSIGKLKYIGGFAQFGGNPTLEEQWKKIKNAE